MLLIEHRFRSGPLDGKSSDPGDRIGVGAVESVVGYNNAEGSSPTSTRKLGLSHPGRGKRRDDGILSITVSRRAQPCQLR